MAPWHRILLMATVALAATTKFRYKYTIRFVGCTDRECNGKPVGHQDTTWKWIKDRECHSYHHDSFHGFQYTWDGEPAGPSCPDCPEVFGHCNIMVYEEEKCRGREMARVQDANKMYQKSYSPGYAVGEPGDTAKSMWVECRGAPW